MRASENDENIAARGHDDGDGDEDAKAEQENEVEGEVGVRGRFSDAESDDDEEKGVEGGAKEVEGGHEDFGLNLNSRTTISWLCCLCAIHSTSIWSNAWAVPGSGQYLWHLSLPFSYSFESMRINGLSVSQIMRQKSPNVSGIGACVAI